MKQPPFEKSVFINCPFDADYASLLQAAAFCLTYNGYYPRITTEVASNASGRLERVAELIRGSKFSIHDLSRCKASTIGEFARMNMPFELGLDYGCLAFGGDKFSSKIVLILEHTRDDYSESLSDIAGWDIHPHNGDVLTLVRIITDWLNHQAPPQSARPGAVMTQYATFQGWHWHRELESGASEDDIRAYPTITMLRAMREWVDSQAI